MTLYKSEGPHFEVRYIFSGGFTLSLNPWKVTITMHPAIEMFSDIMDTLRYYSGEI